MVWTDHLPDFLLATLQANPALYNPPTRVFCKSAGLDWSV